MLRRLDGPAKVNRWRLTPNHLDPNERVALLHRKAMITILHEEDSDRRIQVVTATWPRRSYRILPTTWPRGKSVASAIACQC